MKLIHGDCLDVMKDIPDKSIDLILADLPYGTTACKWDSIIPLDLLWNEYNRIIKDNGAVVLFSAQPFTSLLVMSNISIFKYSWVWRKNKTTGHLNAKKMPLKAHEDICIFYKKQCTYNPQMKKGKTHGTAGALKIDITSVYGKQSYIKPKKLSNEYYPNTELIFGVVYYPIHPTQKPVDLLEYLIKTYSNEGDLVLDNTMGSGSTGIACINTNRQFIGIEKDLEIFNKAVERINNHVS